MTNGQGAVQSMGAGDGRSVSTEDVVRYYASWEARIFYSLLLGGVKHFGTTPRERSACRCGQRKTSWRIG